jgi:hypothetical protein
VGAGCTNGLADLAAAAPPLHLCLLLLVATKCRPDVLLQAHRHSRTDSTAAGCSPVEHSPQERVSVSAGQSAAGCCTAREWLWAQ